MVGKLSSPGNVINVLDRSGETRKLRNIYQPTCRMAYNNNHNDDDGINDNDDEEDTATDNDDDDNHNDK